MDPRPAHPACGGAGGRRVLALLAARADDRTDVVRQGQRVTRSVSQAHGRPGGGTSPRPSCFHHRRLDSWWPHRPTAGPAVDAKLRLRHPAPRGREVPVPRASRHHRRRPGQVCFRRAGGHRRRLGHVRGRTRGADGAGCEGGGGEHVQVDSAGRQQGRVYRVLLTRVRAMQGVRAVVGRGGGQVQIRSHPPHCQAGRGGERHPAGELRQVPDTHVLPGQRQAAPHRIHGPLDHRRPL
mmetsp:Transcript_12076/g.20965  ORF Transcript_12076/g.20965 Transcript_12076/m.20965 type:complete len:238 (-) Transcript_12076:558-1271(-)